MKASMTYSDRKSLIFNDNCRLWLAALMWYNE